MTGRELLTPLVLALILGSLGAKGIVSPESASGAHDFGFSRTNPLISSSTEGKSTFITSGYLTISSVLTSRENIERPFTTILQIIDQEGFTISIGLYNSTIRSGEHKETKFMTNLEAGEYLVSLFDLSQIDDVPEALSNAVQSRITVYSTNKDKGGVEMIYPTKPNGAEWYLDMDDPLSDDRFFPTGNPFKDQDPEFLNKQPDGSWRIGNGKARMLVAGDPSFRDVEITGYVKLVSTRFPQDSFTWYARGGLHWEDRACEGSALKGSILYDGSAAFFKKEMWHLGDDVGYTPRAGDVQKVTSPLLERWIGMKVMFYNINNDTASKMELWLDEEADGSWRKITEYTDAGGWAASSESPGCGNPITGQPLQKDDIITWGGQFVTFRADHSVFDFRNLSVREISVSGQE